MARPRKFEERDAILAARGQFWDHGYEGTTLSDLCAATGLGSQSIYGAFENKHALFIRTLDDYCDAQLAGLRTGRETTASRWGWLMSAVAFEDNGRIGLTSDGCYLSGSTAALSRLDPEVYAASRSTYREILAIFEETVTEAQRLGEVRDDVEARVVAFALLTSMQGLEFVRKSGIGDDFEMAKESVTSSLTRAYALTSSRENAQP